MKRRCFAAGYAVFMVNAKVPGAKFREQLAIHCYLFPASLTANLRFDST
jgi:hypothetical protein